MENELIKQCVVLNDKYQEVLLENKRLRKYIDYNDKFKETQEKDILKSGIIIGENKFNLIDYLRGFIIGMLITLLINLITNP